MYVTIADKLESCWLATLLTENEEVTYGAIVLTVPYLIITYVMHFIGVLRYGWVFISYLFGHIITFFIYLAIICYIIRLICRYATFIGAISMLSDDVVSCFASKFEIKLSQTFKNINNLVALLKSDPLPSVSVIEDAIEFPTISLLIQILRYLEEQNYLIDIYKPFYLLIQDLANQISQLSSLLSVHSDLTNHKTELINIANIMQEKLHIIEAMNIKYYNINKIFESSSIKTLLINLYLTFTQTPGLVTYDFLRGYLIASQDYEEFTLTTSDGKGTINGLYRTSKNNSNRAIILANPNGVIYETMSTLLDQTWVNYFYKHNYNVCIYNYRGYGRSKGSPSLQNLHDDFDTLISYIHNFKSVDYFGVYGYSIGGAVVCHSISNNMVKFVIADRNFSEMKDVVKCLLGNFIGFLYDNLSENKVNNSLTYDNNDNCVKIITNSINDEIIIYPSSLLVGISKECEKKDHNIHLIPIDSFVEQYLFLYDHCNKTDHSPMILCDIFHHIETFDFLGVELRKVYSKHGVEGLKDYMLCGMVFNYVFNKIYKPKHTIDQLISYLEENKNVDSRVDLLCHSLCLIKEGIKPRENLGYLIVLSCCHNDTIDHTSFHLITEILKNEGIIERK